MHLALGGSLLPIALPKPLLDDHHQLLLDMCARREAKEGKGEIEDNNDDNNNSNRIISNHAPKPTSTLSVTNI